MFRIEVDKGFIAALIQGEDSNYRTFESVVVISR